MKVCAIIVLYNPDYAKLHRLFLSVCSQVSSIIFVDNTPNIEGQNKNQQWIKKLDFSNGYYLSMNDNLGIATAQNKGIEFAKTLNAEFVLLLDQDSALPDKMVAQLLSAKQKMLDSGLPVFAVGPAFLDEKTNKLAKIIKHKGLLINRIIPNKELPYIEADYIISSGSIVDIKNIEKVGLLRDDLFIDWVDIEWCLRAKKNGLNTYVIPSVIMNHSIGDDNVKLLNINLHSDFRNYFIVRNSLYLALYGDLPINFKIIQFFKTPAYVLFYSYHSKKPFYSLKLLLTAIKDGVIKKMGKGYFENKGL